MGIRRVGAGLVAGALLLAPVVTVTPAQANVTGITIAKVRTGVASIVAGGSQATEFTVEISNLNPLLPLPAFFADRMDDGLVIGEITTSSPAMQCQKRTGSDTEFWCFQPLVPKDSSVTVTVTTTAPASTRAGVYVNCAGLGHPPVSDPQTLATMTWPGTVCDPVEESDLPEVTAEVEVTNEADFAVTATHPAAPVNPGDTTTIPVGVTNVGPSDASTPVTVRSTLPAGVTYVSGSSPWNCTATGQDVECTWVPAPPAAVNEGPPAVLFPVGATAPELVLEVATAAPATVGFYDVTVTASSATPDSTPADDSATARINVTPVDLAIAKAGSGTFQPGTNADWTLTVSNVGTIPDAGSVTVTDTLASGLEYVSATGTGWTCSAVAQVVTCTRAGLPLAASQQITVLAKVTAAQAEFGNAATVTTSSFEQNLANNTTAITANTSAVDLAISKAAVTTVATVGEQATWRLTVSNVGSVSDPGTITVTDTLPVGQELVSAAGTGWTCGTGVRQFTCTRTGLAAQASGPIDVTALVTGGVPQVTNEATVTTTSYEANLANNSATATMTVRREAQSAAPLPNSPRKVKTGRTEQGQKIRTSVTCRPLKAAAAGETSYCKVIRKNGFLRVKVIGTSPMKVRIRQTAKGTDIYKPFVQQKTYIVRP